jgi:Ca2+-binding RTX toxin-like protein
MVVKIGTFGNDLLLGTNGADTLQGSFGDDTLRGYKGNDLLVGGGGDDTLEGGKGNDTLYGDAGDDHLDGGAGTDTAVFNTAGDVDVSLQLGSASGSLGNDTLEEVENVTTGDGDDVIYGNGSKNVLNAGNGSDFMSGAGGNDTLNGGGGDDELAGGHGVDVLTGGSGSDYFAFYADSESGTDSGVGASNRDIIMDFNQAQNDVIDIGDIGDLSFIGQAAFSSVNQVRYFHSGGDTIVQVNHVGDAGVDLEIQLEGVVNLNGSDFLL